MSATWDVLYVRGNSKDDAGRLPPVWYHPRKWVSSIINTSIPILFGKWSTRRIYWIRAFTVLYALYAHRHPGWTLTWIIPSWLPIASSAHERIGNKLETSPVDEQSHTWILHGVLSKRRSFLTHKKVLTAHLSVFPLSFSYTVISNIYISSTSQSGTSLFSILSSVFYFYSWWQP